MVVGLSVIATTVKIKIGNKIQYKSYTRMLVIPCIRGIVVITFQTFNDFRNLTLEGNKI